MEDYKPNSHKFKEEQRRANSEKPRVEKVVTGKVRTKKKTEIRKFADAFCPEDLSSVGSYILGDVVIPYLKKAIDDIVSNGIHMLLYPGEPRSSNTVASKIQYGKCFTKESERPSYGIRARNDYSYDDVIFDNRGDAEEVLYRMDEAIGVYGLISVNDYYDFAGVSRTGNSSDCKYGWTQIRTARVVHTQDGWIIKLPRALPLD